MSVVESHVKLGELMEAQLLQEEVLESTENTPSTTVEVIKNNLAYIFVKQGRWKEAEELFVQVMETSETGLGLEHLDTLASMANLASTFWNQGRWKEAEELFVQVMETRKRVFGQEHPDSLTSVANLAMTYQIQGRWKEAEKLEAPVMEALKRVVDQGHPNTLTSMTKGHHELQVHILASVRSLHPGFHVPLPTRALISPPFPPHSVLLPF